jgi:WhiB family redox-sensing transcriptional regulator
MPAFPRVQQPAILAELGLCSSSPYPLWTSSGREQREAARRICGGCGVRAECLAYALTLPASDLSIWAATSAAERVKIRRDLRAEAAGTAA